MNVANAQADATEFSAERVVQAIQAVSSPDKDLQRQANEYLELFAHTTNLRLDVVGELLALDSPVLHMYAWNLLYQKLVNREVTLRHPEAGPIRQMAEKVLGQVTKQPVWTQAVARVLAYFVYREFEENDFRFLENAPSPHDGQALNHLLVLTKVAEFLKTGAFHDRRVRFIESEIKQNSRKIAADLTHYLSRPALVGAAVEALGFLASKVSFLLHPPLIAQLSLLLAQAVSQADAPAADALLTALTDIITSSDYANLRETAALETINQDYLGLLQSLETKSMEELMALRSDDARTNFTISFLFLTQTVNVLERNTPSNFSMYLSTLLSNFGHVLMAPSATAAFLFGKLKSLLEFPSLSQSLLMLGFEWLYIHLKYLGQDVDSIPWEVLQANRELLVAYSAAWLRTVTHPDVRVAREYFTYYTHRELTGDEATRLVEDRTSSADYLGDICIQWKPVYPLLFWDDIGSVVQAKLEAQGTPESQALNLEASIFFLKSLLPVIVEDKPGVEFLKKVLGLVSSKFSLDDDFILLGLLWLCHELSIEGFLDQDLHASLLRLTGQILTSHRLPVLEKMAAEAFNNLIKEAQDIPIGSSDIRERVEKVALGKMQQLLEAPSDAGLKEQGVVMATTVGAYLSLLHKLFSESAGPAVAAMTAFFGQVTSTFGPLLSNPADQKSFYVFLVVAKAIVEAYEITKDLNDISQADLAFSGQIEDFLKQIIGPSLSRFEVSFSSPLLRPVYYQTLREVVTKFSDNDIQYFSTMFPLCLQGDCRDPLKLTLFEKIVLMNADHPANSVFIGSLIPQIDAKFLAAFQRKDGRVSLSKNEDFEAEFVTLQNTLLTHFHSQFLSSPDALNKISLICELFQASGSHGLNREALRFL